MNALFKVIVGTLAWASCLWGVLQLSLVSISGVHTHGICGPWGCGPPVSALVACHGFWLIVVAPPIAFLIRFCSTERIRFVGRLLTFVGIVSLVAVGIWEAATWLPKIPHGEPTYFVRRYLFSVVTLIDLPTVPITLAGIVAMVAARAKKRKQTRTMKNRHGEVNERLPEQV